MYYCFGFSVSKSVIEQVVPVPNCSLNSDTLLAAPPTKRKQYKITLYPHPAQRPPEPLLQQSTMKMSALVSPEFVRICTAAPLQEIYLSPQFTVDGVQDALTTPTHQMLDPNHPCIENLVEGVSNVGNPSWSPTLESVLVSQASSMEGPQTPKVPVVMGLVVSPEPGRLCFTPPLPEKPYRMMDPAVGVQNAILLNLPTMKSVLSTQASSLEAPHPLLNVPLSLPSSHSLLNVPLSLPSSHSLLNVPLSLLSSHYPSDHELPASKLKELECPLPALNGEASYPDWLRQCCDAHSASMDLFGLFWLDGKIQRNSAVIRWFD